MDRHLLRLPAAIQLPGRHSIQLAQLLAFDLHRPDCRTRSSLYFQVHKEQLLSAGH